MTPFPFTAIVGHDDLRLALLANAVDPSVGGVLVRGERGTAKSTAVRSLVRLLPPVDVVAGCAFGCDPVSPDPDCPSGPHAEPAAESRPVRLVELPVGASTDRVAGSMDVERALTEGVRAFDPGLLAAANRGVLYVDEVNLLADHLVDLLLDAAALGANYVERDGVSVCHEARFLLIGTMNPEEGDLRPQLLDRFGLSVEVRGSREPEVRAEVVRRRLAFDADPDGFADRFAGDEADLSRRIAAARSLLPHVRLPEREIDRIARVCANLEVDGLRADIVCAKAARAIAALEGADEVGEDHVRDAALLALAHRRRRGPLEQPGMDPDELDRALASEPDHEPPDDDGPGGGPSGGGPAPGGPNGESPDRGERPPPGELPYAPEAPSRERTEAPQPGVAAAPLDLRATGRGMAGRRAAGEAETGRPVGAREYRSGAGVAVLPTVLAAAPHQARRGRARPGLALVRGDLRSPVVEGREGALIVFVLDASGSMGARRRMATVKGAVIATLLDAYQRRDLVALVAARGDAAELVLPPTASVERARAALERLATGGRTPLGAGLERARALVRSRRLCDPGRAAAVLLITDGRANSGSADPAAETRRAAAALAREGARLHVVDAEDGAVRLGLARELAEAAGTAPIVLADLAGASARRAA